MLVLAHTGKEDALRSARLVIDRLIAAGIAVRVTDAEAPPWPAPELPWRRPARAPPRARSW